MTVVYCLTILSRDAERPCMPPTVISKPWKSLWKMLPVTFE